MVMSKQSKMKTEFKVADVKLPLMTKREKTSVWIFRGAPLSIFIIDDFSEKLSYTGVN